MRIVILLALGLSAAACVQPSHDPLAQEVARRDCYTCHRSDYEDATDPVHVGNNPTTCWECHSTDAWEPALEGGDHPENEFPINNGPHESITCTDCHDPSLGSSIGGMNVSCIGCHTGEHSMSRMNAQHDEVGNYHWDESRPAFCRDCHPRGLN